MDKLVTKKNIEIKSSKEIQWAYRASIELAQQVPVYVIEYLGLDIIEGDRLRS